MRDVGNVCAKLSNPYSRYQSGGLEQRLKKPFPLFCGRQEVRATHAAVQKPEIASRTIERRLERRPHSICQHSDQPWRNQHPHWSMFIHAHIEVTSVASRATPRQTWPSLATMDAECRKGGNCLAACLAWHQLRNPLAQSTRHSTLVATRGLRHRVRLLNNRHLRVEKHRFLPAVWTCDRRADVLLVEFKMLTARHTDAFYQHICLHLKQFQHRPVVSAMKFNT